MSYENYIRVLGSADWRPTAYNDHSCYTVNDRILIDACPSVVVNLLSQGVDPIDCKTICFTHMHADHCMGLPPLLLYWRVRKSSLGELTIVGPKATLRRAFERALYFVFGDKEKIDAALKEMPKLVEIEGCGSFETPEFEIYAIDSDHACPGLCYRVTDKASGRVVGFTGDTRYMDTLPDLFRNADLLLHEASFGAGPLTEFNKICRHSSAQEAVRVCDEAGVRSLALTHTYEPNREGALNYATQHLSIPVQWALPGTKLTY